MIHDPDLLDRLDALPKESVDGEVLRGTRQRLDPFASGGRWMRCDGAGVLYTSLACEGALAEVSFHWGNSTRARQPVTLHTLRVMAHRTLNLAGPERPHGGLHGEWDQQQGRAGIHV